MASGFHHVTLRKVKFIGTAKPRQIIQPNTACVVVVGPVAEQ